MQYKRSFVIILSILFLVTVIAVAFFAFSVNEIDIEFSTTQSSDRIESVKENLEKYKGKNLFFLNKDELKSSLESDTFIKCASVKKSFPDKVFVSIEERKGVYVVDYSEKKYLIDEDGFVLSEFNGEINREKIALKFSGVELNAVEIGKTLSCNDDFSLDIAFGSAKVADLTDCIKSMTIENKTVQTDVVFETYTAVKIRITNVADSGEEKTSKAFNVYNTEEKDYVKSFNELDVYISNGEIKTVWTRYGE